MKFTKRIAIVAALVASVTIATFAQQLTPAPASTFIQFVRGAFAANVTELMPLAFFSNNRGDSLVAQALPELTEIVRMGGSYQVQTSAAVAALTATPTTVAALSLYNGESATGRTYVIDSISEFEIVVDATQSNSTALFVLNNVVPVTAPADAALSIRSLAGRKYSGRARTVVGGTITNDGWFPAGASAASAPAAGGSAWKVIDVPLRGLYIVPPGGLFSVQASKVAATAAQAQFVIRWHEVQLTLGF